MEKSLAIPMKAKMKKQNIFTLNDDCLAEVLRYLPLKDVQRAIEADKRFQRPACIRFSYGGVDQIDPEFIRKYPKEMREDFTEAFGKSATTIKFKLVNGIDFIQMIPHFRNLKELILSEIRIDGHEKLAFPGGLQSLELDRCCIDEILIRPWLKQLNATLTHLRIIDRSPETSPISAIDELCNVESLLIDGLSETSAHLVGRFLDLNKNNILCLTLIESGIYKTNLLSFWRDFEKLQKLKQLHLNHLPLLESEAGSNLFPQLTTLNLPGRCEFLIQNLACEESLHTLIIEDYNGEISSLVRFRNLRRLELFSREWDGSNVSDLALFKQLPKLETLVLNCGVFDTVDDVLGIPRSMPKLRKLSLEVILIFNERKEDAETVEKRLNARFKKSFPKLEVELSIAEE